jgi:GNAT superfamily N-acetyltransferase
MESLPADVRVRRLSGTNVAQTISIRSADAADVPRIVALLNAAFAMERDFIDKDRTSAPEIARYRETGTFFVIDAEGGALDACMYLEPRGDRMYLGMLAVRPGQQGRGLGRRMMAEAERRAAEAGCCAIDIRIVNRRTELPPFYRGLGFVDNGTEPLVEPKLTKPAHFIRMTKSAGQGGQGR